ncbi:uncharacterized protein BXZ73DRAFT_78577 [Epithele typhae]|uniref:uncharacterized protein n=1 Tax=Epithele typhae TaxID=378194 RepID=UPI0020075E7A|nr:uncharacterized protein BXZ73DRAFT_78577 [Epithele typhae]KAH9927093.1 hypothetical protein BXZ73DRAFT_78577 [Epithele typhae]
MPEFSLLILPHVLSLLVVLDRTQSASHPNPSMTIPERPASIHDLAVEVLDLIFTLACTDGGHTGRSLSLVSRSFRNVARAPRFTSVSLTRIRHVCQFLYCLETERKVRRIRVRHLFLSTWMDGEQVGQIRNGSRVLEPDILPCSPILASATGPSWRLWPILQVELDKRFLEQLPRLFKAVADDLYTLSIVHSWEFGAIHFPTAFPLLEELTICGPQPTFSLGITDTSSCFPGLDRLHIVCRNVSIAPWICHAPAVSLLRLSDVGPSAYQLACQLRVFLGLSAAPAVRPLLKHVRIQPRTAERPSPTYDIEQNMFLWRLQHVRTYDDVFLEVMQQRYCAEGHWSRRIRRKWREGSKRISCWWRTCEHEEGREMECDEGVDDVEIVYPEDVQRLHLLLHYGIAHRLWSSQTAHCSERRTLFSHAGRKRHRLPTPPHLVSTGQTSAVTGGARPRPTAHPHARNSVRRHDSAPTGTGKGGQQGPVALRNSRARDVMAAAGGPWRREKTYSDGGLERG